MAGSQHKRDGDEAARWAELARWTRQGDKDALSELYDASAGQVFGLIVRIVGDRAAAEEVALDVYMQVWRGASSFDPERGSATAWLLLLARSRAIHWLRSKAGQSRRREQGPANEHREIADGSPDPEAAVEADDRRAVIVAALGGLDSEKREAIELACFGGLSHGEISERLGLPPGAVQARLRAGIRQLRAALEPWGGAP